MENTMKDFNINTGTFVVANFFNTAIRLAFWCGLMEYGFICLKKYGVLEALFAVMK